MSLSLTAFSLFSLRLATSYDIDWSPAYTYYDGGTLNPYLITLRGSDPEYALICFEEIVDEDFAGICETLQLDVPNNQITSVSKEIFSDVNASIPFEIQIYNDGPTNNFILGYTAGPYRSSGPGEILMGQFDPSTGSITYGAEAAVFNEDFNDETRLIELQNDGYFIVCSAVGPNNQYNTGCRMASYDTETLAIEIGNRTFDMTRDHPTHSMVVERIAGNGFVACFAEYVQKFGACYVGTLIYNENQGIDSEIIFSDEHIFYNNVNEPIDDVKIVHINATMIAICYDTHYSIGEGGRGVCIMAVLQQIGALWTMLILPQRFEFADHSIQSLSLFRVNANSLAPNFNNPELITLCYVDGSDGFCKFGEVDLETFSIYFDDETTNNFHPSGQRVGTITASYLGYGKGNSDEANYLVICYTQFSGSTPLFNRGFCKLGTITDTTAH